MPPSEMSGMNEKWCGFICTLSSGEVNRNFVDVWDFLPHSDTLIYTFSKDVK